MALAWLLQRAPNLLLIAGTSSVAHLHQNFAAGALRLPPEAIPQLDRVAMASQASRAAGQQEQS